jgi:hypothetical protein
MEGPVRSDTYEVIPFRGVIPAVPVLDPEPQLVDEFRSAHTIRITGAPAFMAVAWVRETYWRFIKEGHPLRRRGRIRGKHTFHPLTLVGLVRHLIATRDAKNPEQALGLLEELRVLPYGTAKDLYYRVVQEDRFKPILLEFPEYAQRVPAAELQGVLSRVEMPEPGRPVQRKIQDPRLGEVEITFRAQ